jgi:leader peptidase (prepilin peptidase) / N-methyltransferase
LVIGQDKARWSEHFSRDSDRLLMTCPELKIDGERFENASLEFHYNRLQVGGRTWELERLATIGGNLTEATIPREAMGFGDVKFMACIGAFLGWQAVLFTLGVGSVLGVIASAVTIAIGKREWSANVPFGPYLAAGALIGLFYGPVITEWFVGYIDWLSPLG